MSVFSSRLLRTFAWAGLGACAAGCGGIDPVTPDLEQEEIGHVESTLCTDSGAQDYSAMLGSQPGDAVSHITGSSYGSSLCASKYVVEALNTSGKEISAGAGWVNSLLIQTQADCEAARVFATVYGGKPTIPTTWDTLGSKMIAGTWDSFFGCSLSWMPDMEVVHLASSPYTRIRVAARAYLLKNSTMTLTPVEGAIRIPVEDPPPPW